jgi:hypothetical protein
MIILNKIKNQIDSGRLDKIQLKKDKNKEMHQNIQKTNIVNLIIGNH